LQIELGSIGASLSVLQSFAAFVQAAHVQLPTEVPSLADCLDTHRMPARRRRFVSKEQIENIRRERQEAHDIFVEWSWFVHS
jgi:hypothetical protein